MRATRLGWLGVAAAALVLWSGAAVPVAWAQADPCADAAPSDNGPCSPTFALPPWGDAGGWTDPSQYSTIRLADVNGDGRDELSL